jgi:hypothetical protein
MALFTDLAAGSGPFMAPGGTLQRRSDRDGYLRVQPTWNLACSHNRNGHPQRSGFHAS